MSDLAARREGRIRKILENSNSRLKKITSATESLDEVPTSSANVPLTKEKEVIFNEQVPEKFSYDEDDVNVIYEDDGRDVRFSEPAIEIPNSNTNTTVRYVLIVLLAIFTRHILLVAEYLEKMDDLIYYRLNNIFLPFFTFEVIDFTFFKPFMQQFKYLNVLYLFNLGLTPTQINNIIRITQIFLQLMQDVMVYLFAFVCFGVVIDLVDFSS